MLLVESISSTQNITLKSKHLLTFIPTPIGNLEDISYRSLKALQDAQTYLCEDTRITKKLLSLLAEKFNIDFQTDQKDFIPLHSHNEEKFVQSLTKDYFEKNIAYVSDAGMPCVSDPGALLVQYCLDNEIEFDLIPGANAVLTAYAMSGFNKTEFTFWGFLPHKGKDRQIKLQKVVNSENLSILYESPHRLLKLLEELKKAIPNREIFLVKELTKVYQKHYKDKVGDLFDELSSENIRGEWVVVIDSQAAQAGEALTYEDIDTLDLAPKQKAKLLSKLTGAKTKDIYNSLLQQNN